MLTFRNGPAQILDPRMKEPPVFIVGAPRSGTTLLRNMLNRHPRFAILLETQFYNYIYLRRRAFGDLGKLWLGAGSLPSIWLPNACTGRA